MKTFFISKEFSFDSNDDFQYRKVRNQDKYYYTSFSPKKKSFWERNDCDDLKNKKGCYVYTWGKRPVYIGLAKGENGFSQECFDGEKIKKINDYLKKKNKSSVTKVTQNYLHIYFVYWDGKNNANLDEEIYEMETDLILRAVSEYGSGQLINTKKTNFKWAIKGFMGDTCMKCMSKEERNNVYQFKTVFSKKPIKVK